MSKVLWNGISNSTRVGSACKLLIALRSRGPGPIGKLPTGFQVGIEIAGETSPSIVEISGVRNPKSPI